MDDCIHCVVRVFVEVHLYKYLLDTSEDATFTVATPHTTVAFSLEPISSDGAQPSLGVSTLNRNTLWLVGQQWWPVTANQLQASSLPPPFYTTTNKRLSLLPLQSCEQLSSFHHLALQKQ